MRFTERLLLRAVRTLLLAIVLVFAPAPTSAHEYDLAETSLVIRSGVEQSPFEESTLPTKRRVISPASERLPQARRGGAALSTGQEQRYRCGYRRYLVNCSWLC
jgi:hypothetical protein